jgi:hypothetical protein
LVENLELNTNIEELDCRNCGLTENQEMKIRILLAKNRYYKKKLAAQLRQAATPVEVEPSEEVTGLSYEQAIENRILAMDEVEEDQLLLTPEFILALQKAKAEAEEKKETKFNRRVTFFDP